MKQCSTCHVSKPFTEFHKNSKLHDGLSTICKGCKKTHQKSFLGAPPFREEGKERLLRSSKSLFPCMGCRILGTLSVSAFPAYWYGACKGFLNLADVAACTRWHGEQQCFQRATADALSAVYGSLFLCAVQRSPGPPTIGYEAPGFQMRRLGTYQGCEVTNRLSQMPP